MPSSILLRASFSLATPSKGHITAITGAGSGIGKAIALSFLNAGSNVVAIDKSADSLAELTRGLEAQPGGAGGRRLFCHAADISRGGDVAALFDDIAEVMGAPPSVLCNCAGITRDGWLAKLEEAQWDDVMSVNLKGTFLMSKEFVRHRLAAGGEKPGGSIVNISSIVGKAGNMGQTSYAASKAGVVGFTKSAAKELARHEIRVNAILPGFILTPMVTGVPDKVKTKMLKQITLGEFGDPQQVADAAMFLSSTSAEYMTGNTLEVAGGLWA